MYDKIDLYVFDPQLIDRMATAIENNTASIKIGNCSDFKYKLMNGQTHANAHGLTIEITQKVKGDSIAPPMLHISGSIRKWHYGKLSMYDLTRYDTLTVLNRLANELGITYDEFKDLPLSAVEVGLNLDLGGVKCESIKSRICFFKDFRYKCMDAEGYKIFKAKKYYGKVYDKIQERRNEIKKMSDRLGAEHFESEYGDKNILRVEFKAYGGATSVCRYFGLKTIDDMVVNYNKIGWKWQRYALKFEFKGADILPFTPQKGTTKEFTDYIKCRGALDISDIEMQAFLYSLPAQTRKDARKAVKSIYKNMPDTVNAEYLFRQIVNAHFIGQLKKSYYQYEDEMRLAKTPTLL